MDAHKNFAYGTIATAPSPATSGTSLVVAAGQGALFPAVPFNATIWPVGVNPLTTNAEIVRVTNISTDTLTIARAQEGSSARTVIVGDQIAATITAKTLTDVEGILGNQTLATVAGTLVQFVENTTNGSATPTPTGDARVNWYQMVALASASAFQPPSGTPANHNELNIRIKDNGTARALTYDAIYRASTDLPLPATTVLGKTLYMRFLYNSASSTWDLVGVLNNF